jgi:hypothetical protein
MSATDLLLQQVINGLSLGAMYALLALGFTLVYGILELINFSHFNVFMIGSFIGMWTLQLFGLSGQNIILVGLPLAGALIAAFAVTMVCSGALGVLIERVSLRPLRNVKGPAAMITTIGVSYILFNIVLLTVGADSKNFPNPLPDIAWHFGDAVLRLREVLIWIISSVLMVALYLFVQKSRMGKASAHDGRGSRQGHHDRVLPGLRPGRRRRARVRPLLQLHQLHHRLHRRTAGLHRGRAGRHRQRAGGDGGRHHYRHGRGVRRPAHLGVLDGRDHLLAAGPGSRVPSGRTVWAPCAHEVLKAAA